MRIVPVPVDEPGAGEVRVRQQAIGLNFADIYQRRGDAGPHAGELPAVLGSQGAGVIEMVGEGVQAYAPGDRVAYIHPGAYADTMVLPADRLVALPDSVDAQAAAGFLLRGLTAEYLLHRLYAVRPGDAVLVHAAAGGMGQMLCPWARALGAHVIGTVGSVAKRERAQANGCHEVIVYREPGWADRVLAASGGQGVAVVYDAVGKDVFVDSLACLRPRGLAINYGTASGDVRGLDLQLLHAKSLSVCRPTLRSFIATREELQAAAARFFAAATEGLLDLTVARRYALDDVHRAHADLESGSTTGAAVLVP
ncbi:quinone oxidoreductase [Verticiella sediminum]|uniref:Quinone oxidoreductase n=1 Tax=Verticiella sediminum TaxID=1247510 RepID=A0A556AQC0_9BURK|nr:quinone oxidoreductase [Verticiella sediminum]TSH95118.1 quinone oxidoreductase [Verticiella sediminum]